MLPTIDLVRIPATSGFVGLDPARIDTLAAEHSVTAGLQALDDWNPDDDDGLHVTPERKRAAAHGDIDVHRAALRALAPRRRVTVSRFAIGRDRVTNAQYAAFVAETGHAQPRHWIDGVVPAGLARHAVLYVSHDDASAFAAWIGLELPTEVEWEIAAGGADGRRYPWGDQTLSVLESLRRTKCSISVDAYPELASPLGVRGLFGAWEWCADLFGAASPRRALRGGFAYQQQWLIQARVGNDPSVRDLPYTFRCVRRPSPERAR